jgi:hypothetical protein
MLTIKVIERQSGRPMKREKVGICFSGWTGGCTDEWTDYEGDAHFDLNPGNGEVFFNGKSVYKGRIEGRVVVYV